MSARRIQGFEYTCDKCGGRAHQRRPIQFVEPTQRGR